MHIRSYHAADEAQVIALWELCFGYPEPRNRPALIIADKLALDDGLLIVAEHSGRVRATALAGFDGHRGWLYRVAVHPEQRRAGIGRALVAEAEARLQSLGCHKINLQTHADNARAVEFWRALGYRVEARISLGKEMTSAKPDVLV